MKDKLAINSKSSAAHKILVGPTTTITCGRDNIVSWELIYLFIDAKFACPHSHHSQQKKNPGMCLVWFADANSKAQKSDRRLLSTVSGGQPPSYSPGRNDASDDVSFLTRKSKQGESAEAAKKKKRGRVG